MSEVIHQLSLDIGAAGELSPEQLEQACRAGWKAVLNLRQPKEKGFLQNEAEIVTGLGMVYAHVPVNPGALNDALVAQVCAEIERLAKPLLIHCSLGLRSTGMAMIYLGRRQGLTTAEFLAQVQKMGLDFAARPGVERFFLDYIERNCQPKLSEEKP